MGVPRRSGQFDYSVFGLRIRSDLMLPELMPGPPQESDVRIRLGRIPLGSEPEPGIHPIDGSALLKIADVASYWVSEGCEIIVQPEAGAAEQNIRLYLLGSALGVLIHQRGLLPLHANAVEIGGRAVAFMGHSGAGKSTLAAWFHDRGFPVIADDVCVVRFDGEGRPFATPGLPRLRLWKDALEASGRELVDFDRSYAGDENWDKFDVPLPSAGVVRSEKEIAAIYLLTRGGSTGVAPIAALDAAEALFANTYRGAYLTAVGDPGAHYQACLQLVRRTPLFAFSRSFDLSRLDSEAAEVVRHAEGLIESGVRT